MRRLLLIVTALLLTPLPSGADAADNAEVRILMDVSASMQRTDPDNLRHPAMRLTAELLPADTAAGVWMFAERVTVLVPNAPVDDSWRQRARGGAEDIHSRGQATDIGAALETAAGDWMGEPVGDGDNRHIVLFTDGRVSISSDDDEDAAERERIIDELVPALNTREITVHAIGLSDEIDQEVLEVIAESTGGRMAITRDADELERVFLRLFDQIAPRDSLPLRGNTFLVDDSVSEMTVLAFRDQQEDAVRLLTPDGETMDTSMAEGSRLRWRSEPHHDLITIDSPETGEWTLLGAEDPDNRVMIVTDLQLHMDALPPYTIAGESLTMSGYLTEGGIPIDRDDFLNLTRFRLEADDGTSSELPRVNDTAEHRLEYKVDPGSRDFTLRVSADTFEREARQQVEVVETPLIMSRGELPDQPDLERELRITPIADVVDTSTITVEITVEPEDGDAQLLRFAEPDNNGEWRIRLDTLDPYQDFHFTVEAVGTMADGRTYRATVDAFDSAGLDGGDRAQTPHWGLLGGLLFTLNVILFGIIGLVFYLLQGRRAKTPSLGRSDESARQKTNASEKA